MSNQAKIKVDKVHVKKTSIKLYILTGTHTEARIKEINKCRGVLKVYCLEMWSDHKSLHQLGNIMTF